MSEDDKKSQGGRENVELQHVQRVDEQRTTDTKPCASRA